MSEILNSYAGKLPTFLQQKGCVHFAEILQNCEVCATEEIFKFLYKQPKFPVADLHSKILDARPP